MWVIVGGKMSALKNIEQKLVYCQNTQGKLFELENMIDEGRIEAPCMIFA